MNVYLPWKYFVTLSTVYSPQQSGRNSSNNFKGVKNQMPKFHREEILQHRCINCSVSFQTAGLPTDLTIDKPWQFCEPVSYFKNLFTYICICRDAYILYASYLCIHTHHTDVLLLVEAWWKQLPQHIPLFN